ncbi:unnamed protein product [Medioppia subpectinata]|uniref:Methyltransferase type 11 domain-containing protein n=1 Tax=Medioppia subpectinata TaxID=1979941 RepID=A0A7R9Q3X8_9ACAR|nr:unnamed protein product [Medioppia subpectinata]CAG2110876.1 unnamed protein product [Medioppia subpectinata]
MDLGYILEIQQNIHPTVILEIGPARGNNFEFYPSNCRVIALDYNSYFEKYFRENKSKFPNILCEDFVNGRAEDMREIEDNSVDVVVATYVLCSVKDRYKTLREIQRVLKKGGTYYFMEHVGYPHTSSWHIFLFAIQLLLQPFWYAFLGGCHCHRQSWSYIEKAGFHTLDLNYEYPNEMVFIARAHIWGTATTHQSDDCNHKK